MTRMLSFLLLMFSSVTWAELYSPKINFQHVLENKDLVLGVVLSLHQDSDGYLWFGGENGVMRYDGYKLKQIDAIDPEGDGTQTRPVAMVVDIFEGRDGDIWVGSGGGVLIYDRKTERLVSVPDHPSLSELALSTVSVRKLAELENGKIAAATYSGLFIVDKHTGEGKLYRTAEGLSPGRINDVKHTGNNILWVGTASGLDRMDANTGDIKQFKPYAAAPDSASDNGVVSIEFAKDGLAWLGTDKGLIRFDPDTLAYKRYEHQADNPNSFSGGDIWDVMIDSNGLIWVATDGGGLNQFDPKSEKFAHFKYEAGRPGSLNSSVVRTVIEDRNGDIWAGNYPTGVNFFDKSSAAIISYVNDPNDENSLSYNSVMSVVADEKGNIWAGTDAAGLNYFNRETNQFVRYPHDPNDPNTVSANAVLSMLIDSKNILWGGTWAGGVFQVDLNNNNRITRMPNDPRRAETKMISTSKKLNNDKVWVIYEDKLGTIWIGTHEGGLNRYDRTTGEYTHYIATEDPESISGNQVWKVYEDSLNNLWVGTTSGLGILDRDTGKFENFTYVEGQEGSLASPSVMSIYEDSKNRMWFGTGGGLALLDRKTKTFKNFAEKDGLANASIRSIVEDPQGRLWLGTNSGVTAFDPETYKVKNYNRESGKLVGGFNYNAGLMTPMGEAVFGGKKGLRIYNTTKMQDNKTPPPIVLTNLRVLSEDVKIGAEDGLLTNSINFTENLTLDYTQSVVEFEFAALNYRDSGKNRYAYMLEGFDDGWIDAGDQRRAKYTNLDAGHYHFRVKGTNNDGVWNEIGKSVKISQLPPPWQTWWAYTLYTLFVLALIAWFIQAQRKKRKAIEEQNRILEIKVAERTAEISKKNKDIENMLTNMHQGLFTIEGEGTIHPEYSKYLESIFETDKVAGRNVIELLFKDSPMGSDVVNQVQEAIAAIVGEDEMNFDFNEHLLVDEYDIKLGEQVKNLSVDWNPIVVDDLVDKLMVTVRDVTELKKMEAEAKAQQKELDIISQLLNVSSKKYLDFEKTSAAFLKENRQYIEATDIKDEKVIAVLFRNMHTIKGNCRTYGFSHISNIVHEAETLYSNLKQKEGPQWDQAQLLEDINGVEQAIGEYAKVYREVLGRDDKAGDRADGMWVKGETIRELQQGVQSVQLQIPSVKENGAFKPLRAFFTQALSAPLSQVIHDVVESLPSIAEQLDKVPPTVKFDCDNARIKDSSADLFNSIFAHVLRNSVDHGLETASDRKAAGKDEKGEIKISTHIHHGKLRISVSDDGRGLNLAALFDKGVKNGKWQQDNPPSAEEVANLIFESGVSTKQEVSEISGRGVGMDAVRQFLLDKGGDIQLKLLADKTPESDYVPFELLLDFPEQVFVALEEHGFAAVQNF